MFSRISLLGVSAAVAMFWTPGAQAAMPMASPGGFSGSDIQLVYGGCGPGFRRTLFSHRCVRVNAPLRHCQPGTHAESFPSASGYRCVLNR
jgi:hypothetical protein